MSSSTKCPGCGRTLEPRTVSIPESIICYKAGTEDKDIPSNRIVTEWVCPVGGCIWSPGGGMCTPDYNKRLSCYVEDLK